MASTAAGGARGAKKKPDATFAWEGRDRGGKTVSGEVRAQSEVIVQATLRRQGITPTKVTKRRAKRGSL